MLIAIILFGLFLLVAGLAQWRGPLQDNQWIDEHLKEYNKRPIEEKWANAIRYLKEQGKL